MPQPDAYTRPGELWTRWYPVSGRAWALVIGWTDAWNSELGSSRGWLCWIRFGDGATDRTCLSSNHFATYWARVE